MIGVAIYLFVVLVIPNQQPITHHEPFDTLDECLTEARDILTRMRPPDSGGSVQAGCVVVHPPSSEH